MRYNNLTAFPFLLNIANTLISITLNFNRINFVEPAYLKILQKLQMITMRNNLITSFPDVYMSSLTYLGLRYNLLSSFPNWPIIGENLTSLYLSGNKITSISVSSLLKLSKIKSLGLEEMDLQTIPNWCSLPKNAIIGITLPNSLYCDCRLSWLLLTGNYVVKINNQPTCAGPSALAGMPITNLTKLSCNGLYCLRK